ncbi:MAG TPA: branched-chain amino acid ABC transporter permease [Gaiellaceae bacterium]|jgi:branched-chain amino acid transport system permease protein
MPPDAHDTPPASTPRIGADEWVASHESRREGAGGPAGQLKKLLAETPPAALFAAFCIAAALLPFVTSNGYVIQVGFDTLIYMLLALGLNIVVGFAGLLDLGYVAFFGFGAYGYAMLASPQFGLHWPTPAVLVIVMTATVLLGFLVALPSRRLIGDYLAIVTLFFGQLFVTVTNNGQRISVLGFTRSYNVTNGPNGIVNIDPFHFFGAKIDSLRGNYWTVLLLFVVVLVGVYLVSRSRTGRAWRSLREDSLAAEMMGMPVNRLKLLAFAFGAGVAGLTGTIFAAEHTNVFTDDFDTPLLIMIYAILILGGSGSIGGVILGALVVNVTLEVLRTPNHATWLFFAMIIGTLVVKLRPWRLLAVVVAALLAFGFAVHAIVGALSSRDVHGHGAVGGSFGRALSHWVPVPPDPTQAGNYGFVGLIVLILIVTSVKPLWRTILLVPMLYLATFVWDTRLAFEPSITRQILIGVILIVLMNARPQGLLGETRVEIV